MITTMLRNLRRRLADQACILYRLTYLRRVTFIGITGSCGKTTTKELTYQILAKHFQGTKSVGNLNVWWHVRQFIGRVRRSHDFCVLEVGTYGPGTLNESLRMLRPQIGVVTNVGTDHLSKFGSIEAVAQEKSTLVASLPARGTALLNADDPRVLQMASRSRAQVLTFGQSETATYRAKEVSGEWPERLSFTLCHGAEEVPVNTHLCGTYWVTSVLPALAVAHLMGVPLAQAAAAVGDVRPFPGRMSPVETRQGITFIRDDLKAPFWTLPASLEFMKNARARRRIAIIGTISDYSGYMPSKYRATADRALESADYVFFVGKRAGKAISVKHTAVGDRLRAFVSTEQIAKFLRGFLLPGDLVLLKGSEKADFLEGIVAAIDAPSTSNGSNNECDQKARQQLTPRGAADNSDYFVIGLGNPEARYRQTPHNVGRRVVDLLAESHGVTWEQQGAIAIAQIERGGRRMMLIKACVAVNETGAALAEFAKPIASFVERSIVVFDDIALDCGVLRQRNKGSSGGHLGMQSIINTFETESIRRLKVGVGRPAPGVAMVEYVLAPFKSPERELVDEACRKAANLVLQMVTVRAQT